MNQQQKTLDFVARSRHDDPATAKKAAKIINQIGAPKTISAKIVAFLLPAYPYGRDAREIAAGTGLDMQSVTSVPKRLEELGLLERAGTHKSATTHMEVELWRVHSSIMESRKKAVRES